MVLPTCTTAPPSSEASCSYRARTFLPVILVISASSICFSGSLSWRALLTCASAKPWRSFNSCSSLFQDFAEQRQSSVIGQYSYEIPHLSGRAQARGDGIEYGAFAVSGDGRVFHDAAQLIALLEQSLDSVQLL